MVLSRSTNDMQTMIPSHHLALHWSNLQTEALILKREVSCEIGVGRICRFGFDFKNADFINVYVSGSQLIAFDVGF